MSRTRHVGAGVPRDRLPDFGSSPAIQVPTKNVLNVIRVALNVADMRLTGFQECEIEAAKVWVRAAIAKAGDV